MRAVRISASRVGKSRTALLGTRTVVPCDAILGDFVAFKHPKFIQPEKQMRKEMLIEPTGISEKIRAPDGIRTHDPP